jgi:hypothetical protein
MKNFIIAFLLLLFPHAIFAQDIPAFGKIVNNGFLITVCDFDKGQVACGINEKYLQL